MPTTASFSSSTLTARVSSSGEDGVKQVSGSRPSPTHRDPPLIHHTRSISKKIPYDAADGWYCGIKPDLTHTYKTKSCTTTSVALSTVAPPPTSPVCTRVSSGAKTFESVTAKFDNTNDLEGWSCGLITTCGKYGNLCGGHNVKGPNDDIQKTFDVPAGKYLVTLDFIAIDSWFAWSRKRAWVVCCWVGLCVVV